MLIKTYLFCRDIASLEKVLQNIFTTNFVLFLDTGKILLPDFRTPCTTVSYRFSVLRGM